MERHLKISVSCIFKRKGKQEDTDMVTALLLSGGTGKRMGVETPKQYIKVNGSMIIDYCLQTLLKHEEIDAVQIVADEMWQEAILAETGCAGSKFRGFSKPGETRQLSIWNGLTDIGKYAKDVDYVLIHDAARPLVSAKQITECLKAVRAGHDGALPVLPMKDTVYYSEDGAAVTSLLERSRIFAGQAPEIFVLGKYREANQALFPEQILRINGSTEPAVMAGMDISMILGDEGNFKITTKADLKRFREMIGR